MHFRILAWATLALALTVAWTLPGAAQQGQVPAGHVQTTSGDVRILSPQNGETPAEPGAPLFATDEVVTGADGAVQILCADQTMVALAPDSRVRMGEVLHDPEHASNAIFNLEILQGAAGLVSGAVARDNPDGFQVSTPLSYIGIRGTEFVVLVQPDQEVTGLFQGGPVAVTSQASGGTRAARAEICAALAEALDDYERSARLFQDRMDFAGKREARQRADATQELMDAQGCAR